MADNGGGGSGGNTSVFWEVWHGQKGNPQQPRPHNGNGPPPRGHVKVGKVVEGHSDADFSAIGLPDHPGLFKVILRYRDVDWAKVPAGEKAWVEQMAARVGTDRVVTLHVPAIPRAMPGANGKWSDMPWEIQWEW